MNCASCRDIITPDEIPFFVPDGEGGKWETFCPQCFVHERAPMEPERYDARVFKAVKCCALNCGLTSVDCGRGICGQCLGRCTLELPPKLFL